MRGMWNGLSHLLASMGTALLICGVLMVPRQAFAGYVTTNCGNGTCHFESDGDYCSGAPTGCAGSAACGCNDNLTPDCNCNWWQD